MAVAIGAVTTGTINGASSYTISFVSTNQPLYVITPLWYSSQAINTIAYGGTGAGHDLTRVAQSALSTGGNDRVEIWRLLNPTAGTANLVITNSGTNPTGSCAIFNTTGQDVGGTPEGTAKTAASASNGTATGSQAIAGMATGDLVITGIAVGNGAAVTPTNTGGTGLTEFMDVAVGGESSEAFRVSDACTAVAGSWTGSAGWALAAIPLKVAAAATKAPPPPVPYAILQPLLVR